MGKPLQSDEIQQQKAAECHNVRAAKDVIKIVNDLHFFLITTRG